MLFIIGLLLMWCSFIYYLIENGDVYWILTAEGLIGLLGALFASASLIHFAWFVLL